jgi:hypothetical protein
MLKEQNGVCAICKKEEFTTFPKTGIIKSLSVDHCHETGKIRGLLCVHCNRGLGCFKDQINLFSEAINYLERNKNE